MPLGKNRVLWLWHRRTAPAALIDASDQLERLWRGMEPCAAGICTTPPIDCDQPLEDALAALAARTETIARAGQIPVTLGGEHSLTWAARWA